VRSSAATSVLPRDVMHSAAYVIAIAQCMCLSRLCIVLKRVMSSITFSPVGSPVILVYIMAKFWWVLLAMSLQKFVWKRSRFSTTISLYIENDTRQGHSYCRTPIGTRTRYIKWCYFQWPWMTPDPDFKGTLLFDLKYLRNGAR